MLSAQYAVAGDGSAGGEKNMPPVESSQTGAESYIIQALLTPANARRS
jgi:hypothetical protein